MSEYNGIHSFITSCGVCYPLVHKDMFVYLLQTQDSLYPRFWYINHETQLQLKNLEIRSTGVFVAYSLDISDNRSGVWARFRTSAGTSYNDDEQQAWGGSSFPDGGGRGSILKRAP